MSFTTPLFSFFLIVAVVSFVGFNLLKIQRKITRVFLLLASYLFYASWDIIGLILIIITTFSDFLCSNLIFISKKKASKRFFLILSLLINLGILFYFKYYSFFVSNLVSFLSIWEISSSWIPLVNVILPAGISFYTFQSMSYTIDVFRGEILPETNFLNYSLYVSFFPQLVAGPIVPARILLPQLESFTFLEENFKQGLGLLALGLTKKVLIADRLALLVDAFYAEPSAYSSAASILAIFSYSMQIFCDFSGYTDIARASALFFGVTLPENFNSPYLSLSFSEFWRRWHITLSTWLKNYLYISLGGNRLGNVRTIVNLFLTMLLGGLWHGASWNFLLWGFFHGVLLGLERFLKNLLFRVSPVGSTAGNLHFLGFLATFFRWAFVFLVITLLWIPFRSPNLTVTLHVLEKVFIFSSGVNFPNSSQNEFWVLLFLFILLHLIYFQFSPIESYFKKFPTYLLIILFLFFFHVVILLSKDSRPFIYFVF